MTYKILQLCIMLLDVDNPRVWRRVLIPAQAKFIHLHTLIQCAMGWEGSHLFQFMDKTWRQGKAKWHITLPNLYAEEPLQPNERDACTVRLSSILKKEGRKIYYVYDFGDNWEHEIEVEKIYESDKPACRCLTGKGWCPPEDVGGSFGFNHMKRLFRESPYSDEAQSYREWLGVDEDDFRNDPDEYFDFAWYGVGDSNRDLRACTFMRPGLVMELE